MPEPGSIRSPFCLRPAPRARAALPMPDAPKRATKPPRGDFTSLTSAETGRASRACVAALGLDERSELLVGCTRGERMFDGSGRFRYAFLRQEMGGDVVDFADEVVGDGLVLE